MISGEPGLEVVGVAADAAEAVRLVARTSPDVAIVDLRMPGNGISAAAAIRKASPGTRVIALSANVHERRRQTIASGEEIDVLPKGLPSDAILEAIRAAAKGIPPPRSSG